MKIPGDSGRRRVLERIEALVALLRRRRFPGGLAATLRRERQNRKRLEAMIAISTDAIISVDASQRIIFFNEGAARAFGWRADEVLGKPLDVLIPERFRTAHREHVAAFGQGLPSKSRDEHRPGVVGLRRNGEEFPVEAAISMVRVGGKPFYTATLRDITDRVRMAEALRQSEERLRVALQAAPVVAWSQDTELRYTWVHKPWRPLTAEELLGKTDFDFGPLGPGARALVGMKRRVLETGSGARGVVPFGFGGESRYLDVTVEPLRDAAGRVRGITCAGWDVTEQGRAEREQRFLAEAGALLMSSASDYEATLARLGKLAVADFADVFLAEVPESGGKSSFRVALVDPSRVSLAERIERYSLDWRRPHLLYEALVQRRSTLIEEVRPEDLEWRAQNPEHLELIRELGIQSLIAVPMVARGRVLGAFALISARPDRHYGQRELRLAEELARLAALALDNAELHRATQEAMAVRDEILGIVAHDLRSPLNLILMHLDLMARRQGEDGDRADRSTGAIRSAALRMNRLIQDMLDVARMEARALAIERTPLPARWLIEEVLEAGRANAAERGIILRSEGAQELPDVHGDHDRLFQVFENLIGNALKFTPAGGSVAVGGSPEGEEVRFWVRDTGTGISPEEKDHLFDRFWQAKRTDQRGAGLGLPIVKGIVEAHGGSVQVESEPGAGTKVTFTVPVANPVQPERRAEGP